MHRNKLLLQLEEYVPENELDGEARNKLQAFVRAEPECFTRSLLKGHVTGSAWVVDSVGSRVLLTHHRKLNRWLQPGGHADGESNVLAVAIREAQEETGITGVIPVSERIFDLDVHPIPAHGSEPDHFHYDIRYALRVQSNESYVVSPESYDLGWFEIVALSQLVQEESVLRMARKWLRVVHSQIRDGMSLAPCSTRATSIPPSMG